MWKIGNSIFEISIWFEEHHKIKIFGNESSSRRIVQLMRKLRLRPGWHMQCLRTTQCDTMAHCVMLEVRIIDIQILYFYLQFKTAYMNKISYFSIISVPFYFLTQVIKRKTKVCLRKLHKWLFIEKIYQLWLIIQVLCSVV